MSETPVVWQEQVQVRAHEVGPTNEVGIWALCNWLQEAAGNNASSLAWGLEDLRRKDLTWVLARLHVRIDRLPGWREELVVSTWPAGVLRVLAVRDFTLRAGAETLAVATSGWVLVDRTTARPVRPGAALQAMASRMPPRVLLDPFDRLPELGTAVAAITVRVGRSDLDLNGHANNARFITWALDALPQELVAAHVPEDVEVELRAEAREGDELSVEVAPAAAGAGVWLHRVSRPTDGRELARARTTWRPRGERPAAVTDTRPVRVVPE